tara:strand:- start:120 stop:659 length:540 start_codon:yes stop_codon:yes gene_type:complete
MIFPKPLYCITKVGDHYLNKERIISTISYKGRFYEDSFGDKISKTDWLSRGEQKVNWYNYGFSERDRKSYTKFLYKKFGKKETIITETWFQQYDKNSGTQHKFHNHYSEETPNSLTNIYYVELGDKSLRTILIHPKTGKEIIPRVKEGQILTFDATILHRSPPNLSDSRKTVISFNILF